MQSFDRFRHEGVLLCLKLMALFVALCVSFDLFAQNSGAGYDPNLAEFVPGKIYVKFKPGFKTGQFPASLKGMDDDRKSEVNYASEISSFNIASIEKTYKILSARSSNLTYFYTFSFSDDTRKEELIRALAAKPEVEFVEKVPLVRTFCNPNDPDFAIPARSWHLQALSAGGVWCSGLTGCSDVVIAIVDDAVRTTHEDLASKMAGQYDVTNGTFDANPPALATNSSFTHGTHVAGTIGAASRRRPSAAPRIFEPSTCKVTCEAPGIGVVKNSQANVPSLAGTIVAASVLPSGPVA